MEYPTQKIAIRIQIEAKVVGKLAVHANGSSLFHITHIDSGFMVYRTQFEDKAIEIAERLSYLFDDIPALESDEYQSWLKGIVPVIKRIVNTGP